MKLKPSSSKKGCNAAAATAPKAVLRESLMDSSILEMNMTSMHEKYFWTEHVASESTESDISKIKNYLRKRFVLLAQDLATMSRSGSEAWISFWKGLSEGRKAPKIISLKKRYDEFRTADGRVFLLNPYRVNDHINEEVCINKNSGDDDTNANCNLAESNVPVDCGHNSSNFYSDSSKKPQGNGVTGSYMGESSELAADRAAELKAEERFWHNYLKSMTDYIIYIHGINIMMLLVALVFFISYPFTGDYVLYHDLTIDVTLWLLISLICAWALLEFKGSFKFTGLFEAFASPNVSNAITLWRSIAYFVVGIRTLFLCRDMIKARVALMYFGMDSDYSTCRLPEGFQDYGTATVIEMVILRTSLEVSQMGMFSIVPFPSQLILWMCIVEFAIQFRRISGCTPLVTAYGASFSAEHEIYYSSFCNILLLGLLCFYLFVALSSYSILHSSKSTYFSMEKAKASAHNIKCFIKFLCNEIRLPLQMMSKFIDIDEIRSRNESTGFAQIQSDINSNLGRLRLVTSNLILLTKIEDNADLFNATQSINIQRMFNLALSNLHFSFGDISNYLDVYFEHTDIYGNYSVLSTIMDNVVYFALVYIEDMILGNKAVAFPHSIHITFHIEEAPEKNQSLNPKYLLRIKVASDYVKKINKASDTITPQNESSATLIEGGYTFKVAENVSSSALSSHEEEKCNKDSNATESDGIEGEEIIGNKSRSGTEDTRDDKDCLLRDKKEGSENIFQTVLMSCKTIAEGHGGNFTISSNEADLSFLVNIDSGYKLSGQNENKFSSTLDVMLLASGQMSSDVLKNAIESLGFESVAMCEVDGTSLVLDENMDSFLFCDLIFVSDMAYFKALKQLASSKRIVYIGNPGSDASMCDFCLHLPLAQTSIEEFQVWCSSGGSTNSTAKQVDEVVNVSSSDTFQPSSFITRLYRMMNSYRSESYLGSKPLASTSPSIGVQHAVSKSGRNFDFLRAWVGMPLFSISVEESFLKWRIFNPVNSFFHRSMCIDIATCTMLVYYFSLTGYVSTFYLLSFYGLSVFVFILTLRTRFYFGFVEKWGLSVHTLWTFLMFLMLLFFFFALVILFVDVFVLKKKCEAALYGAESTDESIIKVWSLSDKERVVNMSLAHINDNMFGSNSVAKVMLSPLSSAQLVAVWALHVPWPMGYVFNLALALRFLVFNFYVLPFYVEKEFYLSLFTILSMFFGLNAFVLYHFELSTRLEFQVFRKTSHNTKYMELIQNLCQRDLLLALDSLKNNKLSHSKIVFDAAFVSDELLNMIKNTNRVESFFLGHIFIDALLFVMRKETEEGRRLGNSSEEGIAKVALTDHNLELRHDFQVLLLETELREYSRQIQLYCSTLNMRVDVSLFVSPSLGIISANKEKIQSLVMLCLLQAAQNLVARDSEDASSIVRVYEISIRAEPAPHATDSSRRFIEMRKMCITVDDTGISSHHNSRQYAFLLGEYSVNYEERRSSIFRCRQTIIIDYRASIASNSAAQYLKDDDDECFYLIKNQKATMLKFYDDWYHLCFKQNLALDSNYETNIKRKLSILLVEPSKKVSLGLKGIFEMFGWSITTVTNIAVAVYKPKILEVDCVLIDYYTRLEEHADEQTENGYTVDDITALRLLGYESTVIALVDDVSLTLQGQQSDRGMLPSSTSIDHICLLAGFHGVVGRPVVKSTLMEIDQICVKSKVAALVGADATMKSFFNNT